MITCNHHVSHLLTVSSVIYSHVYIFAMCGCSSDGWVLGNVFPLSLCLLAHPNASQGDPA